MIMKTTSGQVGGDIEPVAVRVAAVASRELVTECRCSGFNGVVEVNHA